MSPEPRTILLLGREGQIGAELLALGERFGFAVEGPARRQIDIADAAAVGAALAASRAGLVVNAAAYTAVDRAEREVERAFAVNALGAANLAAACARQGVPLVHLSTDYVFGAAKRAPWREDDPIDPLSVYGASKAAGELAVRAAVERHVILRTSGVFSRHRRNFLKAVLAAAAAGRALEVVDDQTTCPTPACHVAEAILTLAQRLGEGDGWGTYHYCAEGPVTWFAFAGAILEVYAGLGRSAPAPRPVASAAYGAPARRPPYAVLDCGKIAARWAIRPRPWRDELPATVAAVLGAAVHEEAV